MGTISLNMNDLFMFLCLNQSTNKYQVIFYRVRSKK